MSWRPRRGGSPRGPGRRGARPRQSGTSRNGGWRQWWHPPAAGLLDVRLEHLEIRLRRLRVRTRGRQLQVGIEFLGRLGELVVVQVPESEHEMRFSVVWTGRDDGREVL